MTEINFVQKEAELRSLIREIEAGLMSISVASAAMDRLSDAAFEANYGEHEVKESNKDHDKFEKSLYVTVERAQELHKSLSATLATHKDTLPRPRGGGK